LRYGGTGDDAGALKTSEHAHPLRPRAIPYPMS
jgi:hypothetical protein